MDWRSKAIMVVTIASFLLSGCGGSGGDGSGDGGTGGSLKVSSITAGWNQTCALTTAGGVKCWGLGFDITPMDVAGLTDGIKTISAGGGQTCALTTAGGVKCLSGSSTPVDVMGLTSGVMAISAGGGHACALMTTGGVKCWGANFRGQLGDGTTTDESSPVDVVGLSGGIMAISAESNITCALTTIGGVKCWGENSYGQLGDGTTIDKSTPVDVMGLGNGVAAIAAGGDHACALTTIGGVKCWGANSDGQLGDNVAEVFSTAPINVVGLAGGVAAISAASGLTFSLTATGGVKCWGDNYGGSLGDGTTTDRYTPVNVMGLTSGVKLIATGSNHTCVLMTAGGVKCWGNNMDGELGDGTRSDSHVPVDVVGF
jgi:alpha-tubulin suppressor-like RCC1 family protein